MATSTERIRRMRERARGTGLCITCCKMRPASGRQVCDSCKAAVQVRKKRRTNALRERAERQAVYEAHERAGEQALNEHLYEAAGQHYQLALKSPALTENNRTHIEEQLIQALYLGHDPQSADAWIDRLLTRSPQGPENLVKALIQKSRQLWIQAQTPAAVTLLERAKNIAQAANDHALFQRATLGLASTVLNLGYVDRANEYFAEVSRPEKNADASLLGAYYGLHAKLSACRGQKKDAIESFERGLIATQASGKAYAVTAMYLDYAICVEDLGNIDCAKLCNEQALLLVRSNGLEWVIPYATTSYASSLLKIGDTETAYELLRSIVTAESVPPIVQTFYAEVGISVALAMKDEGLLAQCARSEGLDYAFETGIPSIIGPVASAFAELYVLQGKVREAKIVLHRGLLAAPIADRNFDLLIRIAQHGFHSDISQARALLESRTKIPSADVALAFLNLFDALVARRRRRMSEARLYAEKAAHSFEHLGWYMYAGKARALLGERRSKMNLHRKVAQVALHPHLTAREREIAELVVKGCTNKLIGEKLAISERTVETHITSIMNRLGIRSRYQMPEALPLEI